MALGGEGLEVKVKYAYGASKLGCDFIACALSCLLMFSIVFSLTQLQLYHTKKTELCQWLNLKTFLTFPPNGLHVLTFSLFSRVNFAWNQTFGGKC